LLVHPSVPASTAREWVAYAKANPGKLNYGSFGNGSSNQLAYELFKQVAGIEVVHVPYKGGAPLITALLAGEIQSSLDVYATEPLPADSPFWTHPKVVLTPHNAADTDPDAISVYVAEQIAAFERGETLMNVVDRRVGY
jgi:hypothetical protein